MAFLPINLGFTTSEKAFQVEMARLQIEGVEFVPPTFDACVHYLENSSERPSTTAIVCLRPRPNSTQAQIISMLTHEAVHVWQQICEEMREQFPSKEFEAYTIQWITQLLLRAVGIK